MDTQFQVEILRLQCAHLRTLLDQVIGELTTVGHELATEGNHSSPIIAIHLSDLEKQSAHIATETARFQRFLQSLGPPPPDVAESP